MTKSQTQIDHADAAEYMLACAEHPQMIVPGVDQEPPTPLDAPGPLVAVTLDGMTIDPSPGLLAAQVHATLALVTEMREANRIAREATRSNRDIRKTISRDLRESAARSERRARG